VAPPLYRLALSGHKSSPTSDPGFSRYSPPASSYLILYRILGKLKILVVDDQVQQNQESLHGLPDNLNTADLSNIYELYIILI
jgi:hypothetical protein